MYRAIRPLLFTLSPEVAHAVTLASLRVAHRFGLASAPTSTANGVSLMGLRFANRVGVAAGLDKNGTSIDALSALGFGFVEVGTVTPQPQRGNSRPRLFRLKDERAVINRMGFPNRGAHSLVQQLLNKRYTAICGISIGKNADTPLTDASRDYVDCLTVVYGCADYVAVNISSPNTVGLRRLQSGTWLHELLDALVVTRSRLAREHGRHVPIAIKLTADLNDVELVATVRAAVAVGIDGIIATNTTLSRTGLKRPDAVPQGGLSGAPLLTRALEVVQCIRAEVGASFPVIGVGGIVSAQDAEAMRRAGADLLQLYTGLIYRGPALLREILRSSANA